ncbi:MAG: leucine-rich repeat protein [Lachnospiraceae bacterium]|nr:leucine-rich repeat protein [Lachnospiraceae bacterium]
MKKRRVLALFLALSMALSSNGFTALAAEQDPAAAIEAGLSEGTDDTDGESVASDANDENENNASENEDDAQDNTGEDGDASEGGNDVSEGGNGETESGDSSENNDGTDEAGNGNDAAEGSDVSDGTDRTGNDVDASDETDGPETDIEDAESAEDVQIDDEGVEAANSTGVRMCTFTDETGMVVTYDLNASEDYIYEVDDETDPANPVLTGIFEMVNGVEQPVALSGVVELRQPREDEKNFNTIASNVFQNKTEIEYVILPDNVKIIEPGAFSGCTKLRGIKLPSGLEKIQDKTFFGCTKLTQLSIPKCVTSIGSEAFSGDTSLFMVYIKDSTYSSMITIGNSAFEGCKKLEKFGSDTDFVLPGNLTEIGDKAFMDCYAIKKVTLPDSVKEQWVDVKDPVTGEVQKDSNGENIKEKVGGGLGTGVFENCIGLTDVTLSAVSDIPDRAFYNCSNLLSVNFANGNKTIGVSAFEKCIRLSQVIFSNKIDQVCDNAFNGCSNLRYVEIPNANMKEIPSATNVFPNNNADILWMRGFAGTEVEKYAKAHNNMRFIAYTESSTEFFTYTYQCLSANVSGTVTFACDDKVTDPNAKNGKKGVRAGAKIYVFIKSSSSVKLTEGSLRCNGTPIGKDSDGEYTFTMPVGGAYVTAEFERTSQDNKNTLGSASDIKYELSNGGSPKVGQTTQLKVGQTTRLFLIDTSAQAGDSVIESSKIKFTSKNTSVASVSDNGTIKALKKGTAYITAEVLDCNNTRVTRGVDIEVVDAEVRALLLKPFSYDSGVIEDITTDSIVLNKVNVENKETTFTLLATAYDDEDVSVADNMSVALKWTTSDSKVAKIGKSSTTSSESQNTITIPKGASGEAVITATATNADPTDYKKVSEKFIVRVQDFTPRLAASTLTLNPYQENGAELEIIGAYNTQIDVETVELRKYDDKEAPSEEFVLSRPSDEETNDTDNSIVKLIIKPRNASNISDGVYRVTVLVEADGNFYNLPLNIRVKRFIPKPKVTIAKNQPKINLFYANGGTLQKDGSIEPGEVIPVISNLGDLDATKITYSLEPLSTSADDAKFLNNFEVGKYDGIITRTNEAMGYTSGKKAKPVVTGYLVLTFDGYIEPFNQQRYKITIPTKTTKPSLKLERTSDTFKSGMSDTLDVYLALKNGKEIIDLSEGGWEIYKDAEGSTSSAVTIDPADYISDDGRIKLSVNPRGSAGKVVIAIKNVEWDYNQVIKLNYTAKISSKKTTFKLDKSSVTLNKYFSSNTATVTFKSNQYGVLAENMEFEYPSNLSETKEEEYQKVNFTSDPESQQVSVSVDDDIKKGTYRFTCKPLGDNGNKVTLTVKVTNVSPTVSLKGSAKLNLNAGDADTTELTMNFKNKPADIDLNWDDTTIEYVTNREDEDDVSGYFAFNRDGNKLKISLADGVTSSDLSAKTYTFKMTPAYGDIGVDEDTARSVRFKVKVYSKEISVTLKAKGKLNLLDRYDDTYFDNTDVPATESLSMAGEDSYAAVVDSEAVPSFVEGEDETGDGNGDETEIPETPDTPTTTKDLSVEYDIDDTAHVAAVLKEVVETEPDETGEGTTVTAITVDKTTNKTTKGYELTTTVADGYEITSIAAYDSSAKDEVNNSWDDAEPIILGNADNETFTIDKDTVISDTVEGITFVIKSKVSTTTSPDTEGPDDPNPDTTYKLTLTKPEKGVADLGYYVIDNDNELNGSEEYIPVEDSSADIGSITSEQIVAVKVTPSNGYEVDEDSFTMTVEEGEDLPTIEEDTDLADATSKVYIIKEIAANTDVTIKANYIAGKPIKFVTNIGKGTGIKKLIDGNDEADISSEEKTTDEDYTFVVQKAAGKASEISVAVYATGEDDDSSSDLTDITPIKEQLVGENALKYTIAFKDIKDVSADVITIVVTESYTVTITDNTAGDDGESKLTAASLKYKITSDSVLDDATGYIDYDKDDKPKVTTTESFSLQFALSAADVQPNEVIVVKAVDSQGIAKAIEVLTSTEDNGDVIYTANNIEIDENTEITISIENVKTVTLPKLSELTGKVTDIKYALVDSLDSVNTLTANDFNPNPADDDVTFSGDKYLAFMVTLNQGYTVKSFMKEVTSEDDISSQETLEFKKVPVTGLGDIYQLTDKIADGMIVSIQIATSYTITFDKVGPTDGGATIMKSDGTTVTSGGTDSVAEGEDYKFITDKVVDVVASYINAEGEKESVHVEDKVLGENGWEYVIQGKNIKGDIKIVVTDTYGITISNNSPSVVTSYSYTVGSTKYDPYTGTNDLVVYVPYQGSMSINIPSVADKTVLLIEGPLDGENKILEADKANTDSTSTDSVYTIDNVIAERELTIAAAYNIDHVIQSTDNRSNTATVEYTKAIKDDSGQIFVLDGEALEFKVTPNPGYTLTVGYKLPGETAENTLEESNTATAETDGYYAYRIANITGDITITVATARKNAEYNIVKFNVIGATVQLDGETGNITPADWKLEIPVTNPTAEQKTFKFKVNADSDKILRYVGTDKALKAQSPEISGPDSDGVYTFTLPEDPDPETIIYIKASEPGTANVNITFTGLTTSESQPMADIYQVTKDSDFATNKKITTELISVSSVTGVEGDSEFYFIVRAKDGYTLSGVTVDGADVPYTESEVFVNEATTTSNERIYKLDLQDQDVTVKLTLSASGSVDPSPDDPDEPEVSKYPYDPKSCIIYTPVVSNLKDTVDDAKIYDASGRVPDFDDVSDKFDIHVVDGLLYVMPKKDAELDNNKVYPVKIWIHFSKYDSGIDEGGIWVKNTIKIKTAQVLPKVTASTNTINLYQSNTGYTATFILRTKENSIGTFKHEDEADETTKAIVFGEKDEKAKSSLDVKTEVRGDGSLMVTVQLKDGALYAANSTNKVKMYVKFENQAENTLGTAITMNVKVNK